jgi:hypothetical protein
MKILSEAIKLLNAYRRKTQVKDEVSWIMSGYVRDAHAQRIMDNGIIITPPHDFKQISRWYFHVQLLTKYTFGVIICGIKSF